MMRMLRAISPRLVAVALLPLALGTYFLNVGDLSPEIRINLSDPEKVDCMAVFKTEEGAEESLRIQRPRKVRSITFHPPVDSFSELTIADLPDSASIVSARTPMGKVVDRGGEAEKLAEIDKNGKTKVLLDWERYSYRIKVERYFLWGVVPLLMLMLAGCLFPPPARLTTLASIAGWAILISASAAFVGVLLYLGPALSGNLDSTYMRALLEHRDMRGGGVSNSGCPYEGLYTLWSGQSYAMSPAALIAGSTADVGGRIHNAILYLVVSIELLVALLVLCRLRAIPMRVAWGVGLLALFLIFPTRGPGIHQVAALIVFSMEFVALTTLFICAMISASEPRGRSFALHLLVCTMGLALLAIYDHLSIVLAIPAFAIFGIASFWGSGWRRWIAFGACIAPVAILASIVLKGQMDFSQTGFFDAELLNDRQSLFWVSILFQNVPGACVVLFGIAGAIAGVVSGKGVGRRVHVATIVYTVILLALGGIAASSPRYNGPSLLYFEFVIWPFYFLGIAELVTRIIGAAPAPNAAGKIVLQRIGTLCAWVVVALVALESVVETGDPGRDENATWNAWPPGETEIIGSLKNDLRIESGKPFNGYAYTQTILSPVESARSPYPWIAIHLSDHELVKTTGNDHRAFGLIYHGIPTAFQFGGLMSPRYYFAFSRVMGPDLRQMRSRVVTNELNPSFLRMIGVSRIITNEKLADPFVYLDRSAGNGEGVTLGLYQLPDANLGSYSPTQVRRLGDAAEFIKACRSEEVDFRKVAFAERDVEGPLTVADSSSMSFERSGIRVTAKSSARSLLVLPVEFSRCMEVRQSKGNPVEVFPVNLVATGILMEGEVEFVLAKRFGILRNPFALWQDADEFGKILVK